MNPKKTLLFDQHQALGGRIVDFAGWLMPVQYAGILEEHRTVRTTAGVFDISHMGEFFVRGKAACAWLEGLLTNQLSLLEIGQCQYTLMLNERGGVIDDLIAYRIEESEYLLVVNASKIEEDAAWLQSHLFGVQEVEFTNESDQFVGLAVQGPDAGKIYQKIFGRSLPVKNRIEAFALPCGSGWAGITGYTGEEGFEVFLKTTDSQQAGALLELLLAAGASPCGLGARDTLRLEMCYPLNGSDLSPEATPLEAGLGFFVAWDKGNFIGRDVLAAQKAAGLTRKLVALLVEGKAPPLRSHYPIFSENQLIGETSSGALSPSLGMGIALAYLPLAHTKIGSLVEIEIRGRRFSARVVTKPFYKKTN